MDVCYPCRISFLMPIVCFASLRSLFGACVLHGNHFTDQFSTIALQQEASYPAMAPSSFFIMRGMLACLCSYGYCTKTNVFSSLFWLEMRKKNFYCVIACDVCWFCLQAFNVFKFYFLKTFLLISYFQIMYSFYLIFNSLFYRFYSFKFLFFRLCFMNYITFQIDSLAAQA